MAYVPPIPTQSKAKRPLAVVALLGVSSLGIAWVMLFMTNVVTLGGVPYSVLMKFWQDPIARNAYFSGNGQLLHDRMSALGIEASIKAYYRPKIKDEAKLDQHIHQVLYDRTGYVGEAYKISSGRKLVPKDPASVDLEPF
ncbi:MAG TPA: hypothetical protein V6D07_16780 [Trichocoleus sp.]